MLTTKKQSYIPKGISSHLHLVILLLAIITIIILGIEIDVHHYKMAFQRMETDLRVNILRHSKDIAHATRTLSNDTLFLSRTPPLLGIIRAAHNNGMDPVDHNSQSVWEQRLQEIFVAFLNTRNEYSQARYIGVADGGREIVRVNRVAGKAVVVPMPELQRKGNRKYFLEGLKLKNGEVYLSEFNLHREHGVINKPIVPTLRGVTPIFDETGKIFGLLVLNMDGGDLFTAMSNTDRKNKITYITNEQGYYLAHPDPKKAFTFELGNKHQLQTDFPILKGLLQPKNNSENNNFSIQLCSINSRPYYFAATRLHFDPHQPKRFILFMHALPKTNLQAEIEYFREEIIIGVLLSLLIILPILFWLTNRILSPLRQLSKIAEAISQGNYDATSLPNTNFGEIATLTTGFRHMLEQVAIREEKLQQHNAQLVEQVKKGVFDLRLAGKIIENTSEGVMVTDCHGRILSINSAFTDITGYSAEDAIGNTPKILHSNRHDTTFYKTMWERLLSTGHWQGEIWNRRKNGELFLEWLTIDCVPGITSDKKSYVGIFTNITDIHRNNERIRYMAYHDPLTDLPNRALVNDCLLHAINLSQRKLTQMAIMLIDLDRFKYVNDTFGHDVGDILLQNVAKQMQACTRKTDIVARLGGDEFLIIMEFVEKSEYCAKVANKIIQEISTPFTIHGHTVQIGASIGIALYPKDGEDASTLMKNADTAMYQAKHDGKGIYHFYST